VIKVLYDISVLGIGHYFIRAGVVRVVENIMDGLIASNECNVYGHVSSSFHLHPSLDALETRYNADCSVCIQPRQRQLYSEIRDCVLRQQGDKAGKLTKWSLFLTSAVLEMGRCSLIPETDIYHSPFRPLPDAARTKNCTRRFLTVYDLIPIRFPEYYSAGSRFFNVVRTSLQSLRTEDWALCISESTRNDLCEYRPDLNPEQVIVTPLAASPVFRPCHDHSSLDATRQRYGIPAGPYILSLGTLEPRKNLPRLINSFAGLVSQESISDLSLVLVGEKGWQYDDIFREVSVAGLSHDRIVFTGFVPDSDLSALYSGALAFAYLSRYEGFGLPPLEAMQCGVPVITSNTSSLPEVVGSAGVMVPPDDGDGISQAILDLYRDSSLRSVLAAKSLERASLFSWEKCVHRTVEAYRKALNS
jgi:glycosyltransferase involved in cell wall biosynthesis